jgi:hypothetical protein
VTASQGRSAAGLANAATGRLDDRDAGGRMSVPGQKRKTSLRADVFRS